MRKTAFLLVSLALAWQASGQMTAPQALELRYGIPQVAKVNVTVSAQRVTVVGLTPGSSVALLGVARESAGYMSHVVSHRVLLTDDDRDGTIVYAPPRGIAARSVWLVTDFATGEAAVASPAGYNAIDTQELSAGQTNPVKLAGTTLDISHPRVQILVVRPKLGAWFMSARGHGTEPDVGGRLRVDVSKLPPLRRDFEKAPATLIPGDLILMIDEERMEYLVTTITPGGR